MKTYMKTMGRPMKKSSTLEHIHMEMQATASEAAALLEHKPVSALGQEIYGMLKRIEDAAMLANSVNRGIRTPGHQFNAHLARILGQEN